MGGVNISRIFLSCDARACVCHSLTLNYYLCVCHSRCFITQRPHSTLICALTLPSTSSLPPPTLTYSSVRSAPVSVLVQWITCLRAPSLTAHDKNLTHYYSLCLIFSSLPPSCTHPHHFTAVASLGLSVICLAELKRAKLASHCLLCCEEDNEIFSSK